VLLVPGVLIVMGFEVIALPFRLANGGNIR
jgi:hypothetical protein